MVAGGCPPRIAIGRCVAAPIRVRGEPLAGREVGMLDGGRKFGTIDGGCASGVGLGAMMRGGEVRVEGGGDVRVGAIGAPSGPATRSAFGMPLPGRAGLALVGLEDMRDEQAGLPGRFRVPPTSLSRALSSMTSSLCKLT